MNLRMHTYEVGMHHVYMRWVCIMFCGCFVKCGNEEDRELVGELEEKMATHHVLRVCCSVLQCVAVWCSMSKCVAACCSVSNVGMKRTASWLVNWRKRWLRIMFCECVANTLQCVAVCCNILKCVAVCCIVLNVGMKRTAR